MFDEFIKSFEVLKVIELIHENDELHPLPKLFYCKQKESSIHVEYLICRGMFLKGFFDETVARSLGVKMLVKCGFGEIIIISPICSLSDEMELGDLYLPLDAMNLNVVNP